MKKITLSILATAMTAVLALGMVACSGGEQSSAKPAGKRHDAITLKVEGKEEYIPHDYVNGECKYCDAKTTFVQDALGNGKKDVLTYKSATPGKVEEIKYNTRSYYTEKAHPEAGEIAIEKTAYVYLPNGYDANDKTTKYNVFYLMHGNGLNEGYWFARGTYSPENNAYTLGYGTENVLDYLHDKGMCEKTIVVTPTFYSDVEGYEKIDNGDLTALYYQELLNDLMPYIAEHYNTYAKDGSQESLKAARDHQAYAGLSRGSCLSYDSVWAHCLEYISYIGSYSAGAAVDVKPIIENANKLNKKVNYYYACAGTMEMGGENNLNGMLGTYLDFQNGVNGMKPGTNIANGENCTFMLVNKTAHNYATWITALYNSMQVFFKA